MHVKRRCNRILKDYVVQASVKMDLCGPEDLKSLYHLMEARGQHATFAIAKRLLRLSKNLLRTHCVYRPKALMASDTPKQQLAQYYQDLWPKLLNKWRFKAELSQVFDPENPLGAWRQMVQQAYKIKLKLPSKRA